MTTIAQIVDKIVTLHEQRRAISEQIRIINDPKHSGFMTSEYINKTFPQISSKLKEVALNMYNQQLEIIDSEFESILRKP
jgi:spore cortex formation protein SpoVR/YcgB (stage V sporulation)